MKLLIVDDSELLQMKINNYLIRSKEYLEIKQAFNIVRAKNLFYSFQPDTIILDIALPDGNGIDLLKRFKMERPNVKIIIFTNYPTSEFKKKCLELGADHFVDKSNMTSLKDIL